MVWQCPVWQMSIWYATAIKMNPAIESNCQNSTCQHHLLFRVMFESWCQLSCRQQSELHWKCNVVYPKTATFLNSSTTDRGQQSSLGLAVCSAPNPGLKCDARRFKPVAPHTVTAFIARTWILCATALLDWRTRMERSWRAVTSRTGPFPFFFSKNFEKAHAVPSFRLW